MKMLLVTLAVFSLAIPAFAEDGEKTVQELREEIARLKADLARIQQESTANFSTSVAFRTKFEAAVARINEANDVARQWRSQAINNQRELSYTKAIAQAAGVKGLEKGETSEAPQFRVSNITNRPNTITPRDCVAPTYVAMR